MNLKTLADEKSTLQICWIVLGFICLGSSLSPVIDGDGAARYLDLVNIAQGEKPIDKFSSLQMILAMPLYYLGGLLGSPEVWVGYFNLIVFATALSSLWFLLPKDRRFAVIVLLMSAAMLPHHIRYFYGEVLSVMATTVGLVCLYKRKHLMAALSLGIGAAQTPATLPALSLVLLYTAFKTRKIWYGFYLLIPIIITLGDNWFKYSTPFFSAYLQAGEHGAKTIMPYSGLPGFSYPLFFGVLSVLFSFGKGLSFFAPGLFLRWNLPQTTDSDQPFVKLIDLQLVFLLGLIATYSRWWGWYGGQFWGPRYLLFASVPACFLLAYFSNQAVRGFSRQIFYLVAVILSGWVCVQGYLYGNSDLAICGDNKSALELLCWYVPEFSPLFRQFVIGFHEVPINRLLYAAWCIVTVLTILTNRAPRETRFSV
jgi:hypothetical protein